MQRGSPHIESEHLPLGILRENDTVPSLLGGATHAVADFRTTIERIGSVGQPLTGPVEVPLSADSKRIPMLAAEEADALNHHKICLAHSLLGTLKVEKSTAAEILLSAGATVLVFREKTIQKHAVGRQM